MRAWWKSVGRDERMLAARLLAREHGEEDDAAAAMRASAQSGPDRGSARLLQHGEEQRRDAAGQEQRPAHVDGIAAARRAISIIFVATRTKAMTPSGRLIEKIERQPKVTVRQAPENGAGQAGHAPDRR